MEFAALAGGGSRGAAAAYHHWLQAAQLPALRCSLRTAATSRPALIMKSSGSIQAPLLGSAGGGKSASFHTQQRQRRQQQQSTSSSSLASSRSASSSMSGRLRAVVSPPSDDDSSSSGGGGGGGGGRGSSSALPVQGGVMSDEGEGRTIRQRVRRVQHTLSNRLIEVFPAMTQEQALTLSPWQKYKDFNRFPFKFVLQMVLLVLVTAQTSFYASTVLPYFNQVCAVCDGCRSSSLCPAALRKDACWRRD
eukprot:COSAG01_NODE_4149_length_5293_cov_71.856180_2_plen_249_part_00